MAERAFTRALGATCASPVAAFCVLEDGDLRMRAQLFSEDGSEMVEERAVFDCGDDKTPAELARALLAKAPESIRRLFAARMRRVLVLRPEPGASATVERARERGLDAVAIPLFEIEPVAWEAPEAERLRRPAADQRQCACACGGDGLQALRGLPVYAVGEATAEAAREAGFDIASDRRRRGRPAARLDRAGPEAAASRAARTARAPADATQAITPIAVYRSRSRSRRRRSERRRGQRRADPFAARRPALRRAGRAIDAARSRSPRSARPRPRPRAPAGQRSKPPSSRPTTRCWPLRHGCATSSPRMNGTAIEADELGRAAADRRWC